MLLAIVQLAAGTTVASAQQSGAQGKKRPNTRSSYLDAEFTNRCADPGKLTPTERMYCAEAPRIVQNEFITTRALGNYVSTFGTEFQQKLRALGANQHWVDLGSGESFAIEDYLLIQCNASRRESVNSNTRSPAQACPALPPDQLLTRARVTGITLRLAREVPSHGGKLRVLKDRFFSEIPDSEIGPIDLATDLYGVLTYTRTLDQDLAKILRLLSPSGSLYVFGNLTMRNNVVEARGKTITVLAWLQSIRGLRVEEQEGGSTLKISKIPGVQIDIPKLTLRKSNDGAPPKRTFALAPGVHAVQSAPPTRRLASRPAVPPNTQAPKPARGDADKPF